LKKLFHIVIVLTLLIFTGSSVISQSDVTAIVVTKTLDNFINVRGIAQNNTVTYQEEYSYLLFSLKKGGSGNYSRNTQSGEFSLEPGEEKELSTLKINIQDNEEVKIYLFLRKEGVLISKDSTIIYSAEKQALKEFINETEIEIKGLVVEDVKTKLGKDFYDYFYQKYHNSGRKYPFVINIIEMPSFGRGSKITIDIDDRIVFAFMTKPNDEYIQSAAVQALKYVNNYAIQRKLLYKNKKI
jgi:hypothetical protein